jgi:hypothetical protein
MNFKWFEILLTPQALHRICQSGTYALESDCKDSQNDCENSNQRKNIPHL